MKKSKKIMLRVIPVLLVLAVVLTTNLYATNPINAGTALPTGSVSGNVQKTVGNVWSTVVVVLQVLAVAAVVFAGVRYMFASADTKADIKMQMIILVLGAVLVFGATSVLQLIQNATNDIL